MMRNKIYFAALLFFVSANAHAQNLPVWTRSVSSLTDSALVFPVKTISDGNNHIYVLSTYYKTFGAGNFTNKLYLNKYDHTGGLLWSLIYDNGGSGKPRGFDMALDISGNCYIAGGFMESLNFQPLLMKVSAGGSVMWMRDSTISFNEGRYDQVILKNNFLYLSSTNGVAVFDLNGNEQWSHSVFVQRIAVDTKGQLIAAVSTSGNINILRYDSLGTVNFSDSTIYTKRIATDSYDSFYLLTEYGPSGYELVKYDSAGIFQWSVDSFPVPPPSFGDIGLELMVDYYNDVIVIGVNDTLVKLSPSGNVIWTRPMNGLDSYLLSAEITDFNFIAVAGIVPDTAGYNMRAVFFDLNGNLSWQGDFNGNVSGQEYTVDMTIDYTGVYVLENNADSTVLAKFASPFASGIDYSLVCVDSVWYDPLDPQFINVQVFNGSAGQLNYPSVQIVSSPGDTIGNPSNYVQLFAQIGNTYSIYHDTITTAGITDFSNFTFLISEGFGDTTVVIHWCDALAVQDPVEPVLKVYPNPVLDWLYIAATPDKKFSAEIYNVLGKKVFERKLPDKPIRAIDVSSFANGIYFIRLNDGKNMRAAKFVKQ
jgi:hypothetical protein